MFWAMIVERLAGARGRVLGGQRRPHRGAHVGRQIGRRPGDELDHAVEEGGKHPGSIIQLKSRGLGTPQSRRNAASQAAPTPRHEIPHRTRSAWRAPRPGGRLLRRADAARRRELSDQRHDRAARAGHRHRPDQEGGGGSQSPRSAGSTATIADAIVAAADEILAGAAARSVRRRRLSGRRRHLAQHERQRGAGQPRRGDPGRRGAATTSACTRTITSTWASRPTTCSRPRPVSRCWR